MSSLAKKESCSALLAVRSPELYENAGSRPVGEPTCSQRRFQVQYPHTFGQSQEGKAMNRYQIASFAAGLLSGAIVGGTIGMLLAPQSGENARQAIVDKVDDIIQAGNQARFERRKELEAQYKEAIRIPLPVDQEASEALTTRGKAQVVS